MFVTALLAVSLAAPVPKAKAPNYLPLAVGTKWVYGQGGREVSEEVAKVAEKDGETRVTTTYTSGAGDSWESEYVVRDGVVYHARTADFVFDPPVRQVDLDLKTGAKWTSTTPPVKGVLAMTGEMVAGEVEEVTVPAGTFTAVPVVYTVTEENGVRLAKPKAYTYWYADGVGLVKLKYDGGEKVLKEFTPAKDAKR